LDELGKNALKQYEEMSPDWKEHYRRMYDLSKIRWSRPASLSESILELRHA